MPKTTSGVANLIRESLHPITGPSSDYEWNMEEAGEPAETFPSGL